jgi:DNA repair exonuclease SbcCD ATPase subunit
MNSPEVESLVTGITRAEDRIRQLSQPAPDADDIINEIAVARVALDKLLLDRLCQQLEDYRSLTETMRAIWEEVKLERRIMRRQLSDYEQKVKQLEADLERAKRDREVMRAKLDEWSRALNREEEMAAIIGSPSA